MRVGKKRRKDHRSLVARVADEVMSAGMVREEVRGGQRRSAIVYV